MATDNFQTLYQTHGALQGDFQTQSHRFRGQLLYYDSNVEESIVFQFLDFFK